MIIFLDFPLFPWFSSFFGLLLVKNALSRRSDGLGRASAACNHQEHVSSKDINTKNGSSDPLDVFSRSTSLFRSRCLVSIVNSIENNQIREKIRLRRGCHFVGVHFTRVHFARGGPGSEGGSGRGTHTCMHMIDLSRVCYSWRHFAAEKRS